MTIRDKLKEVYWKLWLLFGVVWLTFVLGAAGHSKWLIVIGFGMFVAYWIYEKRKFRCPACRGDLRQWLRRKNFTWDPTKDFRNCPLCGASLDSEISIPSCQPPS